MQEYSREWVKQFIQFVVDDAGCGRRVNADAHAVCREEGLDYLFGKAKYPSRIVFWDFYASETGVEIEPLGVAVHSYLDVAITDDEAIEMAKDYLDELGMVEYSSRNPDTVL